MRLKSICSILLIMMFSLSAVATDDVITVIGQRPENNNNTDYFWVIGHYEPTLLPMDSFNQQLFSPDDEDPFNIPNKTQAQQNTENCIRNIESGNPSTVSPPNPNTGRVMMLYRDSDGATRIYQISPDGTATVNSYDSNADRIENESGNVIACQLIS